MRGPNSYRVTTTDGRVIADCTTSDAAWSAYSLLRGKGVACPRLWGPDIPNAVQVEPGLYVAL